MKFQGTLTKWNDERGFGFIKPTGGGQDVFVNIKAFPRGRGRPSDGVRLAFSVEVGPDGKKRATSVEYAAMARAAAPSPRSAARRGPPWPLLSVVTLCAFPVVYAAASWMWGVSAYVLAAYAVLSAVAFVVYRADKSAAERNAWRVPEANLHLLSLVGGWPGATLAQQFLRHKSKKAEFRFVHWAVVLANLGAFWFLARAGVLRLLAI